MRRSDKHKGLGKECGLHRNGIEVQVDVKVDDQSEIVEIHKHAPLKKSERISTIISTEHSLITLMTMVRNFLMPRPSIE